MEKRILFAGKELPAGNDLASGATFHGRKVFISAESIEETSSSSNGAVPILWNKSSQLSSRSLLLNCTNEGGIDEAVLVFDESLYASKFGNTTETDRILEELIASYQYLTQGLLSKSTKKNDPESSLKLVFLYKSNPSLCDGITSNAIKNSGVTLTYPLVAAAGGAFRSYAENIAATLVDDRRVTPVLVMCDAANDLASRDSSLAVWLCEYMDAIDNLKKPLSSKQKVTWVKAGAKNPSGFGLFG